MELQLYINNIARCLGIVDILYTRRQYHQFKTFTSVILSYKLIIYKSQQHSTSLWSSINFRSIYIPAFVKPLIFYQFQSIIHPSIQQASDILSVSDQYTYQRSSRLYYSINFRALSRTSFNKPMTFYQFHRNMQPSIH